MMTVTEAAEDRAAAAARWATARQESADRAASQSDLRRDQRVEEARAADAARPGPGNREQTTPTPHRLVDISA